MKKLTLIMAVFITAMFATSVSAQTQLGTPTIKSASGVSTSGITAYWTAGTGTATTFTVTIYDATSTIVTTGSAAGGVATLAITGLTLAKNTPYTYAVTAIGDGDVTFSNSAESPKSIPFYIQTDNTVVFQYAAADVTTLNSDLKSTTGASGAADIYELTESGGAYTFSTGSTSNNNTLIRNTTVRAAAGLTAKPILKLNSTTAGSTPNIFNTAASTANLTVRFDGLEFDGVNAGGTGQPMLFYDQNTGASNIKLYINNCYLHDFKNAPGNGIIRLNGSSGTQTLDVQGSVFNACGGRILYLNGTTTSPTTTLNLKNNTFSNSVTLTSRNNVIYNTVGNPGTVTIDHCTFNVAADATVATGVIRTTGTNGTLTLKNSIFVSTPTTLPGGFSVSYCYLGGLNAGTSGASYTGATNTIATAPTYAGAGSTPPNLTITNRASLVGLDGLTVGNDIYYNLATPTIGTGSGATSSSFYANWTTVANASSYDVTLYQNGTQVGSVRNASGQATATLLISGLDASTAYTYRVMAKGDGTNYFNSFISAESAPYSTSAPSGITLATPTASTATGLTTFSFTANWSNTDVNASGGYNVKVYSGVTLVNTYNAPSASATSLLINSGLTYNTAYTYTVTAIGNGGSYTNSAASNIISVSTNDRTTLTTPTAGAATPASNGFTASWSADANASSFSVKTYVGSNLVSTTTSAAGTTSIAVSGLLSGIDYSYTVTSIGDGITYITSSVSSAQSFTTTGRVSTITTDFSDVVIWGTPLASVPVTGTYGAATTVNGFDLNAAALTAVTTKGPKGESHTNRISLDKNTVAASVTLPTISSVGQLEIHFAMGTAANTINLKEYSSATNTWTLVGTYAYDAANKTAGIDQIVIVPFASAHTNAKFRIENNTGGSCYIVQVIARTTNPALLTAPTVGSASNIKATTFTANWTSVDANATGYSVKVYKGTTLKVTTPANGQVTTSIGVTGLQADSTYTYKVQSVGDGDANYSDSYQTVASGSFVTEHQDYYQTQTSGNWGDVSTWQSSTDNTTWSNTIITPSSASSVASIAIMNGHTVTVAATASASVLNVNPGAKLTLNNGITFTANTLNLISDATNGTGTFVDNGGTLTAGTTNVQQYLTGGRNWYISSPISNATSHVFNASSNILYNYDETNAAWPQITDNVTGLGIMTGYVANMTTNGAVTFTGTLNTGAQQIGLTRNGSIKQGFNLVGNPYPSYLNFESALASTSTANVSQTMWFRSKNADTYVFDAYNALNHIGTSNNNNNLIGVTAEIAPMQAVWVRVDAGQTVGTLAVDNTMRSHQDQSIVTNRFKAPATTVPVLHLQVTNGTTSDEAIVLFNSNASNGYDAYDSEKMTNANASIPEIYTLAGTEQLVINGLNSIQYDTEIPLGFTTGQSNTFTIKASQFSNFVSGTQIILRDKELNFEQDLTVANYSFTSDVTTNNTSRFAVVFKAPSVATGINTAINGNVWISTNANNQVVINGGGSVAIYNAVGQKLSAKNLTANTTVIDTPLQSGVYMVAVTNSGKTTTQKVIIK